jgi:hypothetical protein
VPVPSILPDGFLSEAACSEGEEKGGRERRAGRGAAAPREGMQLEQQPTVPGEWGFKMETPGSAGPHDEGQASELFLSQPRYLRTHHSLQ